MISWRVVVSSKGGNAMVRALVGSLLLFATMPVHVGCEDRGSATNSTPTAALFEVEYVGLGKVEAEKQNSFAAFLDKPFKELNEQIDDGLEMAASVTASQSDCPPYVRVRTPREWIRRVQTGYCCSTTYGMTMEGWLKRQCLPPMILAGAQPAKQSFVRDYRFTRESLNRLPPFSFYFAEPGDLDQQVEHAWATNQSWVKFFPKLRITGSSDWQLAVDNDDWATYLDVLAYADVNADGIEDMVVFWANYCTEGTLRSFRVEVLTRFGPDSRFQPIADEEDILKKWRE